MEKGVIPIILGVMGVIVVGLGVLVYLQLRPTPEIRYESDGDTEFAGPAIDSGARIEIEVLRAQIEALGVQIEQLEQRMLENRAPTSTGPTGGGQDQGQFIGDGVDSISGSHAQVVLIANRRNLNKGLQIASPSYLESVFGKPRENLTSTCQGMTNQRLASKLKTQQVGPVRVRMLQPALDSLGRVFDQIKATDENLYSRINTAGALCVRHIRGAPGRTSTHAFGLSLDLNIDGKLDRLGDGKTQLGLTILADFFRAEGWYWGAGFSREDSMHFEVSRDLVEKWIADGLL
ncbi:M15 family metallopeptidase [uncultured Tateyamaria sp.]|uniref:M15 family metallopeptidase n=1 Tax=uncultured Tateyamaria sp. TaxID=455651 RepID=UPI002604623C|nr:M15 family metallopeptidase [uncultured Tateyamaria sp.]